jgi:hypothetical protein
MTDVADREVKVLDEAPGSLPLMLRAALPALPGVSALPGVRRTGGSDLPAVAVQRRGVGIDAANVAAYSQVCAFPRKDTLPLTYLHMLAFPLHMTVMTDRAFPFPAMGTVHLENSITQHRRVTAAETFDVSVWAEALRAHPKGRVFDLRTEISSGGETVWEEVSTYLRRGSGDDDAPSGTELPVPDDRGIEWRLPGDLGRRYASVSGDRNPIHLYGATAKAFGFPRQIAHGMWSKARCVAAIENRIPESVRVDVVFKTPILLPGSVTFTSDVREGETGFGLRNPKNNAPHLAGRATSL